MSLLGRIAGLAACLSLVALAMPANAAYPDKLVHMLVGVAPGGLTDALARVVARKLQEKWGQPVIVENRPGANNTIAEDLVAKAAPDGYTMVLTHTGHVASPYLMPLSYDPVKSFAPVTELIYAPHVLVINPKRTPVNSLKELIDLARAKPGQLNFGSGGAGALPSLNMVLLNNLAGAQITEVIYQGMAPAAVALLGGEIDVIFSSLNTLVPHVQAGNLRALAVSTRERVSTLPGVPTVAEALNLPAFETQDWYGVLTTAGTPPDIVRKLQQDMAASLKDPELHEFLSKQDAVIVGSTPEEFSAFIGREMAKWQKVLKP